MGNRYHVPHLFLIAAALAGWTACGGKTAPPMPVSRGYAVPLVDLAADTGRQVVVDREPGRYLGHPTTVLLEDGRTMIAVYPQGHGRGPIVMKRSGDGGLTWSERLPVPENWATSLETPTVHRVVGRDGTKRLIVWSGLYPARLSVSEDDGTAWTPLAPAGEWGGIVVMSALVERKPFGSGRYLAMFHDDGRFFAKEPRQESPVVFTLYKTMSDDGGRTWSFPEAVHRSSEVHLCEPGIIRSPDGRTLAALLRENSRTRNSFVVFSRDEGATWTAPRELPGSLTGDRHTGKYAPDGRLLISFRDMTHESPTRGDWVAWVGTFDDIVRGREGQYRVRLMDNTEGSDCAYPGVEVLPDGTFVLTTYGHWTAGEEPYIASVRLELAELDRLARR
ncbi:MAG: exo-alpha-sialidase [Candidatus Aminicenantes bacterium]|nr:exo-alpha-sialidase [Candidatus Aminicenantes bacterium]NLH77631.1 exo-alpha-sialidase [Acidobacteriota bacterium]